MQLERVDLDNLTIAQLCAMLDKTDRTIRNWLKDEDLPSKQVGIRRVFVWPEVLGWYVARHPGNRSAIPGNYGKGEARESISDAMLRKTIADADLAEAKLAQIRKEVVEVEVVERTLSGIASGIKQKLEGIPAELTPRLIGQESKTEVHSILDTKMRQICRDLAEMDGEVAE